MEDETGAGLNDFLGLPSYIEDCLLENQYKRLLIVPTHRGFRHHGTPDGSTVSFSNILCEVFLA